MKENMNARKIGAKENCVLLSNYSEYEWAELIKKESDGYSWREEAFLAGDDYFEGGKEFLRSN